MAAVAERDGLNVVEDEVLAMLQDARKLVGSLRGLPEKEKEDQAVESTQALLARLERVQEGLLDNIHLLRDYLPYERSTTQNRLRARQARADLTSVCGALDNLPDEYDAAIGEDEEDEFAQEGTSPQEGSSFSPSERLSKRMRRDG